MLTVCLFGGIAITSFGAAVVYGTDNEMNSYVKEKLDVVSPSIESMKGTINEVKVKSEEIGDMCADPVEISITHCDTNNTNTAIFAQMQAPSQDIIAYVKKIWSALGEHVPTVMLTIGVLTASIATGLGAVKLVGSIFSIVKREQHPTAAQINSRVLPCLTQQNTDLKSVEEELVTTLNES